MKPSPFGYQRATTLAHVFQLWAEAEGEAQLLHGLSGARGGLIDSTCYACADGLKEGIVCWEHGKKERYKQGEDYYPCDSRNDEPAPT